MTLLQRLRELEHDVCNAIQAGEAPNAEHMRLLDEIAFGHVQPEPHEKAAALKVMKRIRRRLGWGMLRRREDEEEMLW